MCMVMDMHCVLTAWLKKRWQESQEWAKMNWGNQDLYYKQEEWTAKMATPNNWIGTGFHDRLQDSTVNTCP